MTLGSSDLGAAPAVHTTFDIDVPQGTRTTTPVFYAAKGFRLTPDKDIADGTHTGDVTAETDVMCDGEPDVLGKAGAPPIVPEDAFERTTNVDPHPGLGDDPEDYVRFGLAPWPLIVRDRADLTTLYLGGDPDIPLPLDPPVPLNSAFMAVPWAPGLTASQTLFAGSPEPPPPMCQESPQNSVSTVKGVLLGNPASGGDDGTPQAAQSELGLHGIWLEDSSSGDSIPNIIELGEGQAITVTVHKELMNQGTAVGTFQDMWVVEEPVLPESAPVSPSIRWIGQGADVCTENGVVVDCATAPRITDLHILKEDVPVGATQSEERNLELDCPAGSDGLSYILAIKNIAWPVYPTVDNNLQNNVALTVVQLNCGDVSGLEPVEKSIVLIEAPHYLSLAMYESAVIPIREVNANHSDVDVDTEEWFDAETDGVFVMDELVDNVGLVWQPEVGDVCTYHGYVIGPFTGDGSGACDVWIAGGGSVTDLHFQELNLGTLDEEEEPRDTNQSDVERDLEITCTEEGVFPLVIKKVLNPKSGLGFMEGANLIDNAMYHVITVACGTTGDEIDDAEGLYPRWTTFTGNEDWRRSLSTSAAGGALSAPQTSSPKDVRYVERNVVLSCFYIGAGGTADQNDWGNWPAGIDDDHDCLADVTMAQPGHAVDLDDDPSDNSDCPAIEYSNSEGNIQVQYNQAADMDCDGLLDGIEKAWGSNPLDADTDDDGASDFLEMFEFTNPLDPDSDDDGLLDLPEDDYEAQAAGGSETGEAANLDDNCPNKYNPTQANNDGLGHSNGLLGGTTGVMGTFNGDTEGDVCDTDDDNDNIVDAAELLYDDQGGSCELDPFNIDTDGDHLADGPEHLMGKDPCASDSPPATLTSAQCLLFRGGNVSVPAEGSYGGVWNSENDGNEDDREEDPDNDGLLNCVDPADDDDGDAPNFGYAGAEITDVIEVRGYNTLPAVVDSDGDGCPDWQEIADVNGDGTANILDVQTSAQCNLGKSAAKGCSTGAPNADSLYVADINKDNANNILDVQLTAVNTLAKGGMPVCSSNQAGANHGQR